ncbi:hypothetical protein SLEP1_g25601 [Rubroshorea leprosula]|uniref:Uncharacterized protein n=1 Tax=Rubroshorea leprosula TaxID=152421 RepID=A0AAV5JPY6_9ROSI|nr:hypothetical protein SLEP1_g25601 [Rubroshorea leprosula]
MCTKLKIMEQNKTYSSPTELSEGNSWRYSPWLCI